MNTLNDAQVSCIIPVFNGERFLGETLDNILAQSHPIAEVIVVDDGSTDGTRGLIESYSAKTAGQVRYFFQENSGPGTARNLGIQVATGEFLVFQDADDLWHPEKTARQLARFDARPELDVVVAHIQNFWMEEVREEEERLRDHRRAQPVAGYVLQTLLMRRTLFERVGLFDPSLLHAHFAEWWLRAEASGIVVELLADILAYRRLHLDSLSRTAAQNSRQEYLRLFQLVRSRQRAQAAIGD